MNLETYSTQIWKSLIEIEATHPSFALLCIGNISHLFFLMLFVYTCYMSNRGFGNGSEPDI